MTKRTKPNDVLTASSHYPCRIGDLIHNKGIYFGRLKLIDPKTGSPYKSEFNMFAAPQDTALLTDDNYGKLVPYHHDVKRIDELRNICGQNGTTLTEEEFYNAIRTGHDAILGKWHMPILPVVQGNESQKHSLYTHREKGRLKGTFGQSAFFGKHDYWTSSTVPYLCGLVPYKYYVNFMSGLKSPGSPGCHHHASRPVRFERSK